MATKTNYLIWFSVLISLLSCVRCFLDIDEFKLATYGIDILRKPVTIGKDEPPGAVYLQSKFGQQYQCSFPDHIEQEKLKEEEEKLAVEIGIPELLRPLETGPCILKVKDWWTYEFCYGKHIRQYHLEDGKITGNIIYLGLYESEFNWDKEEVSSKHTNYLNRYHSQQYVNGTKCDLTEEPRRSEVRFVCEDGSGDYISRIDEPETCVYIVTVHTTKICHHPNLKPKVHSQIVPILCNPVITEEQYQQYLLDVNEERKEKEAEELKNKLSEEMSEDLDSVESETTKKLSAIQAVPTRNPRIELHELIDKVMKMKGTEEDEAIQTDTDSEQPTMEQDTTANRVASSSETESTQGEEDSLDDTDLDEDLDEMDEEDVEGLTSMKQELRSMMETQVDNAIREAEEEVGEDGIFQQEREATMKRLSKTVDKLLDKYARNKKDFDQIEKELKEVSKTPVKSEDSDEDDVEEEEEEEEDQNVKQTDKQTEKQHFTIKNAGQDKNNDRLKVKITRLKSEKSITTDPNVKSIQKHVVETTIKDELKETGLDTEGGKIRVKIITAGYSDTDDSTVHVLSEEDSAAFNKLIVEFLGGNQEAVKEAEQHKELEDNYHVVWGKNNKKSPSP